ncbi:hypothetical protein KAM338_14070 [Aeromonas caviae]|nr:hypothetical protein KAM338_14070 [Aeromonas caviae]
MKLNIALTPEMRVRLMYAETVEIDVPVSCVVPEGWKVVPVEPTDQMYVAGNSAYWSTSTNRGAIVSTYSAMIAAAPQPDEGII